ncbi:hypothetical protein VNO78_02441 [Psophocarpus tetragonolobus]|uniref:Cytochrome P450 n=1 Tax=Psophocarpus tetragonolobus TaxID=3891 RepID=A0AAN9TAQ1_PSOTE
MKLYIFVDQVGSGGAAILRDHHGHFVATKSVFYTLEAEAEVASLVHKIAGSYPGTTNLSEMLQLYAKSVLCRVAFGRDFVQSGDSQRQGFQKVVDEHEELLGGFNIGDFFPSLNFVHSLTGLKSKLQDNARMYDQLIDQILSEHMDSNKVDKEHEDLVDVLLQLQKNGSDEIPLTTDNVKATILDLFAAGTNTTSIALDWAMTELLMNPHVMKKAQKEVRSILGERKVVAESDLDELEYMKAVIKEVFRFHPSVPILLPRESLEDVEIEGYRIPAKTRFLVNAWAIGRNSESWEDPNTFKPERFIGSNIDYRGKDFELIPFGGGRRGCPGVTFAIAAIELALAQLLYSFDWELPPGITPKDLDLSEVFGITTHKREPLHVVAKPYFPQDS